LHDPQLYEDEREFWHSKTPEEKLLILEAIRKTGNKLTNKNNEAVNGDQQRLRRILRIAEQT
jgi:predicted Fe-S protein YdhL (DUF1289 family)